MINIFVTVGNDYRSFHRLIKKIDEVAGMIDAEFIVQYGYSEYVPLKIEKKYKFLDRGEYNKIFSNANLIISHAGIGTIIDTIHKKKKMILVPKQHKLGEHFNNHQLEIAREIEGKYDNIKVLYEIDQLREEIDKMIKREVVFPKPPNLKNIAMVKEIKEFIENEEKK